MALAHAEEAEAVGAALVLLLGVERGADTLMDGGGSDGVGEKTAGVGAGRSRTAGREQSRHLFVGVGLGQVQLVQEAELLPVAVSRDGGVFGKGIQLHRLRAAVGGGCGGGGVAGRREVGVVAVVGDGVDTLGHVDGGLQVHWSGNQDLVTDGALEVGNELVESRLRRDVRELEEVLLEQRGVHLYRRGLAEAGENGTEIGGDVDGEEVRLEDGGEGVEGGEGDVGSSTGEVHPPGEGIALKQGGEVTDPVCLGADATGGEVDGDGEEPGNDVDAVAASALEGRGDGDTRRAGGELGVQSDIVVLKVDAVGVHVRDALERSG